MSSTGDAQLLLDFGHAAPAVLERRLRHVRTADRGRNVVNMYLSIARRAFELADETARLRMVAHALDVHRKRKSHSSFVMQALTLLPYESYKRLAEEIGEGTCFQDQDAPPPPTARAILLVLQQSLSHALCARRS